MSETTFEDILAKEGRLVYKTKGTSMLPMLHQNRDIVVIERPEGRLQPFDVALYRRGPQYVLHRVLEVRGSDYVIRGDNTYVLETGITDEDVLGVLKSFVRKGTPHSVTEPGYLRYVRFWCAIYPVRACFVTLYRRIRRLGGTVLRKLGFRK